LTNEYLADVIKQQQVLAESDPKSYLKENPQNVLLGSLSQAISTLVAKAQAKGDEANAYNLP